MQVCMFFVGLTVACAACLAAYFVADARRHKNGQVIIGRAGDWQKSGIPGFGRVSVEYSIRGRPYACVSGLIPNWRKHLFRPRSMRRYVLRKYTRPDRGGATYVATAVFGPND